MAPAITLKRDEAEIKVLSVEHRRQLLGACDRLRDRFFLALLNESGIRNGEALGLRHEDLHARRHCIHVRPRHNANGARMEGQRTRVVDVLKSNAVRRAAAVTATPGKKVPAIAPIIVGCSNRERRCLGDATLMSTLLDAILRSSAMASPSQCAALGADHLGGRSWEKLRR